jgi:hypothetical protein
VFPRIQRLIDSNYANSCFASKEIPENLVGVFLPAFSFKSIDGKQNLPHVRPMKKESIIQVPKGQMFRMPDPTGLGHDKIFAMVPVRSLPFDMPKEINPRPQDTDSKVAKDIAGGLNERSNVFHLLNRGITILAKEVDMRNNSLRIDFGNGDNFGVIDGGHTYEVIRENVQPLLEQPDGKSPLLDAYVQLEILTNIKHGLTVELAQARNTSAQVKTESLANLEGSFNWLKEIFDKTPFGPKIAYRENEDKREKPLDIREIIGFATMFHPVFEDSDTPPLVSYASKGKCLTMFTTEAYQDGYQKLRAILPDILRFYDYTQLKFAELYEQIGGFGGMEDEGHKGRVKLGKVTEVKHIKSGYPLHYLDQTAFFRFPDGWLYPVVAAHRALVTYKYNYKWKVDPFRFFDKYGKKLVQMTLEASKTLGRNPNAVGKSKAHWGQMHDKVITQFTKLSGVDTDKEIQI